MKLYLVTIQMMAVGVDERDALFSAGSADLDACDSKVEEVITEGDILPEWESALPWGEQENLELTCAEIVKKKKKGGARENQKTNA